MKTHREIAALILAAGFSSRMGALKPLLPLGHATLLDRAIQCFRRGGIEDVTVVLGHDAEKIRPVALQNGVKCVFNPRYAQGMLSSIVAGIQSFDSAIGAFFLLPADIPLVKPETIRHLLRASDSHAAPVLYPCFGGMRGHPPLIRLDGLRDLDPFQAGGLRHYLRALDDRARHVEVMDGGILMDCDTPDDYRRILAHGHRKDIFDGA